MIFQIHPQNQVSEDPSHLTRNAYFCWDMSTGEHKSMKAIAGRLQDALQDLENGALDLGRVDELCEEARELYERLVVLRFKAMEEEVGVRMPKTEQEQATGVDDSLIHPNQTSLIDAIAAASVPVQEKLFDVQIDVDSIAEAEPETPANEEEIQEVDAPENEEIEEDELQKPAPVEFGISLSVSGRDSHQIGEDEEEVHEEVEAEAETQNTIESQNVEAVSSDTSINDQLSSGRRELSLADKLGMTPISDLKNAISLNQKFLFINELFDAKDTAYHEAISEINSFGSYDEAWNYLELNCGAAGWNMEDEVVEQFVELVERRFIA